MGKWNGKDPDRYLLLRKSNYHYHRRIPKQLVVDGVRFVRRSLKTSNIESARAQRNLLEAADDLQWAAQLEGHDLNKAHREYMQAVKRAEVLGLRYRAAWELLAARDVPDIVARIEAVPALAQPQEVVAATGLAEEPKVKISEAFNVYCEEIVPHELVRMSPSQRAGWKKVKLRALNNFIEVVGDKPVTEINGDDARAFYGFWMKRIAGGERLSGSSGNRDVGNIRKLLREYFFYKGQHDRPNPFAGLKTFEYNKKQRPSFPVEWISEKFLNSTALAELNDEARAIFLTVVETGARPSEICNLTPAQIMLKHKIPHIVIEPRDDPDDPREIKSENSERALPLVGVALEAMRKFPKGFPRYKDKETNLSGALQAFLKDNKLLPTPKHSVYSLRHSMETRMRIAKIGDDQRRYVLGHNVPDRPKYGDALLEWLLDPLEKVRLPFDPSVV